MSSLRLVCNFERPVCLSQPSWSVVWQSPDADWVFVNPPCNSSCLTSCVCGRSGPVLLAVRCWRTGLWWVSVLAVCVVGRGWCYWLWDVKELGYDGCQCRPRWTHHRHWHGCHWKVESQQAVPLPAVGCPGLSLLSAYDCSVEQCMWFPLLDVFQFLFHFFNDGVISIFMWTCILFQFCIYFDLIAILFSFRHIQHFELCGQYVHLNTTCECNNVKFCNHFKCCLSLLGRHVPPSHTNAEACLMRWPSVQPQGWGQVQYSTSSSG